MKPKPRLPSSKPTELKPGDTEWEMGIPIPGVIVEQEKWTKTALRKLPEAGHLDIAATFNRTAPLVVDIGCGNGRFTLSSAIRRPECDHLAIDILPAVLRYATRRANQRGLPNIRFAACDGERLVADLLPTASVFEFHIYHPQPFANRRDRHRRLLNANYLTLLDDRLVSGGQVFLQTDNDDYWKVMQRLFPEQFDWQEIDEPWLHDSHGRSRREMLSKDKGLNIHRAIATKRT